MRLDLFTQISCATDSFKYLTLNGTYLLYTTCSDGLKLVQNKSSHIIVSAAKTNDSVKLNLAQRKLLSAIFKFDVVQDVLEFHTDNVNLANLFHMLGDDGLLYAIEDNGFNIAISSSGRFDCRHLEITSHKKSNKISYWHSDGQGDEKIHGTVDLSLESFVRPINLYKSNKLSFNPRYKMSDETSWGSKEQNKRLNEIRARKRKMDRFFGHLSLGSLQQSLAAQRNDVAPIFSADTNRKVHGVSVPKHLYEKTVYDYVDHSYSWYNASENLHSPQPGFPGQITSDGRLRYFQNGFLHNESGPAVCEVNSSRGREWWLWGHEVSEEEHARYDPMSKKIVFRASDGRIHRSGGPAIIEFDEFNRVSRKYFLNGAEVITSNLRDESARVAKIHPITKKKKVVKLATKFVYDKNLYSELTEEEARALAEIFEQNLDHLKKFQTEINEASKKALVNKGLPSDYFERQAEDERRFRRLEEEAAGSRVRKTYKKPIVEKMMSEDYEEGSGISMETRVNVRSEPDRTGTRTEQVVSGFKFGFKKGVVNNASKLVAEKLAALTPMADNALVERFIQMCFLLGSAELIERMPEGMAEKLKMSEEFRLDTGSMLRYVSGDALGRDLVDFAAQILPIFADIVQSMTSEDLSSLTADLEAQVAEAAENEEETESGIDFEPAVHAMNKEQYAEVNAR